MIFTELFAIISGIITSCWLFLHNADNDISDHMLPNDSLSNLNFTCGITNPNERIINGFSTKANFWPWIVSIRTRNSFLNTFSSHLCAGTIINQYFIITAAHCVKGAKSKDLVIIAGVYNLKDTIQNSNIFYVNNFQYNNLYNITQNDVAWVKLSKKLIFSNKIQAICLPPKWINTKILFNKTLTLIGWGSIDGDRKSTSLANSLQETTLKVINGNSKCSEYVSYNTEKIICAIDDQTMRESNACYGDSGGPLMIQYEEKWHLIGITSFIISKQNGHCNPLMPSYYTNLNSYMDWINQTIRLD